jgi:5-methylcytosine-specific restriction endonuclease McrA
MARYKFYDSKRWKKLRDFVINRDGGICTIPGCGQKAEIVHHIIPVNDENCNDPNIVWNPNNLTSLCAFHHSLAHAKLAGHTATNDGWEFDCDGNLIYIGDKPGK